MENSKALVKTFLIVDMQNDFSPEGALPVTHFHKIIPEINALMPYFDQVIATQDWHTKNHISFYTSFENAKPFDSRIINGTKQFLWPVHCVAGTWGADLDGKLNKKLINSTFPKGTRRGADAYSAFHLNDRSATTGLEKMLNPKQVELFVCGVATNICVLNTVKSASELGYAVTVIKDLCAGLGEESEREAFTFMEKLENVWISDSVSVRKELES